MVINTKEKNVMAYLKTLTLPSKANYQVYLSQNPWFHGKDFSLEHCGNTVIKDPTIAIAKHNL
jgi:hypothetical protein